MYLTGGVTVHILFFILGLVLTGQVFAGDTLRLKSGDVQINTQLKTQIKVQTKSQSSTFTVKENGTIPAEARSVKFDFFILQFDRAVTEADKTSLSDKGIELFNYIPDDAFLVKANSALLKRTQKELSYISGFTPFLADYKISEDLKTQSVFTAKKELTLLVSVLEESLAEKVIEKIAHFPSAKVDRMGRYLAVKVSSEELWKLAQIQGVEWVENYPEIQNAMMDNFPLEGGDGVSFSLGDYTDLNGYESGTRLMGFEESWEHGLNGQNQLVAVADTGLDSGKKDQIHLDFGDGVHSGHYFGLWASSWEDPMGHGTHVSGSVVGRGVASDGRIRGGAYGAKLVVEAMWSPVMNNLTVPPELKKLFEPAYQDGARIHTNSWGTRGMGVYNNMSVQVDDYMWNNPDMLILFSAGNSGVDMDKDGRIDSGSVTPPGTAKNILTVGASENFVESGGIQVPINRLRGASEIWGAEPISSDKISDDPNGIAMFSSRGPTLDGRIKPDVVAPGTNILSTRSYHKDASTLWGEYNRDYVYSGGTSMSTPLVAGAVAVLRQYLQEEQGVENPSAALMKGLIMHTATDLFPGQFGEVGESRGQEMLQRRPNNEEGYGLVDINKATSLSDTYFMDEKTGLAQGKVDEYGLNIQGGSLQVTLVYTDAPGAPNASVALVNDLNLELVATNGSIFKSESRVNNSETMEFNDVPKGRYIVRVRGYRVPQGRNGSQPYALLVTGKIVR